MTKHFTDNEIIDSIKTQNDSLDDVLRHLYDANFPTVKKMILSNGGRQEDASDIFQEAIVTLYNSIVDGKFQGKSTLKTYLYAITRNMWLKIIRDSDKVSFTELSKYEAEIELEQSDVENIDKTTLLHKAISQLGKDCQTILLDFYFNKMSMSKIMARFNLGSEQAAKNKKYRCMKELMTLCQKEALTHESDFE